jgi:hypothetical protein
MEMIIGCHHRNNIHTPIMVRVKATARLLNTSLLLLDLEGHLHPLSTVSIHWRSILSLEHPLLSQLPILSQKVTIRIQVRQGMAMDAVMGLVRDMKPQIGKTMVILIRLLLHTQMKGFRQNGRNEDITMVARIKAETIIAIVIRALPKVSTEVIPTFIPLLIQTLAPTAKDLLQAQAQYEVAISIPIKIQTRTHLDPQPLEIWIVDTRIAGMGIMDIPIHSRDQD